MPLLQSDVAVCCCRCSPAAAPAALLPSRALLDAGMRGRVPRAAAAAVAAAHRAQEEQDEERGDDGDDRPRERGLRQVCGQLPVKVHALEALHGQLGAGCDRRGCDPLVCTPIACWTPAVMQARGGGPRARGCRTYRQGPRHGARRPCLAAPGKLSVTMRRKCGVLAPLDAPPRGSERKVLNEALARPGADRSDVLKAPVQD